jgi:acyl-coenzyme A synthetase/AMP-(fatty) acid ligase
MVMQDLTDMVATLGDESQPDWTMLEVGERRASIQQVSRWMHCGAGDLSEDAGAVVVSTSDPIEHVTAVLATLAAGRVPVLVDMRVPDEGLSGIAARMGATACVGRAVDGLRQHSLGSLIDGPAAQRARVGPQELGTVLLTSGSTGQPKLVKRTRQADLYGALNAQLYGYPLERGDRYWMSTPYCGSPFPGILMSAVLSGATVVFAPFEYGRCGEYIADAQIASTYLAPTMIRLLKEKEGFDSPAWDRLRSILTGGERLDQATAALILRRLPGRLVLGYGCTEVTQIAAATDAMLRTNPESVGQIIRLHHVKIVEVGGTEPVALGQEGEIIARGPDMFSGYLGEEDAGDWYRTSDVGRLDVEGFLYVTGRAANIVQVGGNRVSTEEVADALRAHESVAQAAVIALDDPTWTSRLVAFVVVQDGDVVDAESLAAWTGERLSRYKVPRKFHFLDQLPMEAAGKVSLKTLRALATEA